MVCDSFHPPVCPSATTSPAVANGPMDMIFGIVGCEAFLSMYITYNSVSIPSPWEVAGPHGQLASNYIVVTAFDNILFQGSGKLKQFNKDKFETSHKTHP